MKRYVLDEAGEPVALEGDIGDWAAWHATHLEQTLLAITQVSPGVRVSTQFFGLEGCLFETMIFGGRYDQWLVRTEVRRWALDDHARAVAMVRLDAEADDE